MTEIIPHPPKDQQDTPPQDDVANAFPDHRISLEAKALANFMQMSPDDPAFEEAVNRLEYNIGLEVMGDPYEGNRVLAEQSALLDKAFRYYVSGGDAPKPDMRIFMVALRAQAQSAWTLKAMRNMARDISRDQKQRDLHFSQEYKKIKREKEKEERRSSRSAERIFSNWGE